MGNWAPASSRLSTVREENDGKLAYCTLSKFVAFAMNFPKKCKLFIKKSTKGI